MPKSSQKQIEDDEIKILDEIKNNANKSINEIAKKCGFSRQKVWRIINRLEKSNMIWGYITVTDNEKQQQKGFTLLIKRTNKPLDKEMINSIITRKLEIYAQKIGAKIESSLYVHGKYDWVICITAKTIKDAKKFVEAINMSYQGYIQEIQLLEKIFAAKHNGLENPEIEKLREIVEV